MSIVDVYSCAPASTNRAARRSMHDVAHALLRAASPLSTSLPASHWKHCGAEVGCGAGFYPAADFQSAHAPTLSTKVCGARDVPAGDRPLLVSLPRAAGNPEASPRAATRHARVRAPLAGSATIARTAKRLWRQRRSQRDSLSLLATPLDRKISECRHECRHGTQECVRHQNPRPSDRAGQKVCGARAVPARHRRPLVPTPRAAKNAEVLGRAKGDPLRERLCRHKPFAAQAMVAGHAGGARTPACRVATLGDALVLEGTSLAPQTSRRAGATPVPLGFQRFAGRFVEGVAAARKGACATSDLCVTNSTRHAESVLPQAGAA